MAGGKERELRRRIRSVRSTRKITKAMELIAASQIARAQARIAANRPYRDGMARIIVEAAAGDPTAAAKLLGTPEHVRRVVLVVLVGDRGLSGPYNSSVLRAAEHELARLRAAGTEVSVVAVGKKSTSYLTFRGIAVAHSFQGFSDRPTYADAMAVAGVAGAGFAGGTVDQVLVVSMRYRSAASQSVETRQVLPLPEPDEAAMPEEPQGAQGYTEFEPEAEPLLEELALRRSSPRCSPPSSRGPRPSTRSSSARWPRRRRTPTSSSDCSPAS